MVSEMGLLGVRGVHLQITINLEIKSVYIFVYPRIISKILI